MLQFIDGMFHAGGVSFTLPDGFHLDTDPDTPYEYGLCCFSPNKNVYYGIYIDQDCEDTRMELVKMFEPGSGMCQTSEIKPISMNGLEGYETTFSDSEHMYYEVHLQTPEGTTVVFYARCERGTLIELKHCPDTQAVLQTLSVD